MWLDPRWSWGGGGGGLLQVCVQVAVEKGRRGFGDIVRDIMIGVKRRDKYNILRIFPRI